MSGVLKRKAYANCQALSATGDLIFRCNFKRVNWYLKNKLGKLISKKPLTIQLEWCYQDGHKGDKFTLQQRRNKCVCCGKNKSYNMHHILPYCYRKHIISMHVEAYVHDFHDIVVLCVDCHIKYENVYSLQLRKKLSQEYNVPIDGIGFEDKRKMQIYQDARTLKRYGHLMPEHARHRLKSRISKFIGHDVSPSDIDDLSIQIASKYCKLPHYKTHGQRVVEQLTDIQAFVEMWRLHFLETMKPQHMPEHWDVKRSIYTVKTERKQISDAIFEKFNQQQNCPVGDESSQLCQRSFS